MNFYSQLPELHHLACCSLWDLTFVTPFVQMAFPLFHEFDADGTIRTNGLHWEGFPRLAWEALSATGYTTPPTYEVSEFERLGVPRCRVIVTMLPHPDHTDWFDLSFVYWGFCSHETVVSAALRVLMTFATTTLPSWLSLCSGCSPLWVLTTQRGWIIWITFGSYCC
jgi:hypothetical protein